VRLLRRVVPADRRRRRGRVVHRRRCGSVREALRRE
jgi:hypothetical protein